MVVLISIFCHFYIDHNILFEFKTWYRVLNSELSNMGVNTALYSLVLWKFE